ncbi:hypothetical protein [Pedobacter heparinus]|uniref:hypothetical protein n=1 Tax=Pedobacter heparinus TaxID=984 RepID=UPI0029307F05|nr:hypothetical protein [Pedobacter heparinus]
MKPLSFPALLLLVVLISGACKKIPVINQTNSNISFKIDGASKAAKGDKNVFAVFIKDHNLVQINGNLNASAEEEIGLSINNFHGLGEYTTEADFLAVYNTPELDASVIGVEGKIKITEYTAGKSIKGEFQFTGQVAVIKIGTDEEVIETRIFSEGKFQSKITDYSGPILTP